MKIVAQDLNSQNVYRRDSAIEYLGKSGKSAVDFMPQILENVAIFYSDSLVTHFKAIGNISPEQAIAFYSNQLKHRWLVDQGFRANLIIPFD